MEGDPFCLEDSMGIRDSHGVKIPNISHLSFLKKESIQVVVSSMGIPLLHDESHLVLSPKANLHTWEEQVGDILIGEHLV